MKRVSQILDLTCLPKGEILHFKNRLNSGCFDKQPVLFQTNQTLDRTLSTGTF